MTYSPESASCLHNVSGQRTIEAVAPMINSNPGLAGSPKAWVHRSTPLVLIIRWPASSSTAGHTESFIVIFLSSTTAFIKHGVADVGVDSGNPAHRSKGEVELVQEAEAAVLLVCASDPSVGDVAEAEAVVEVNE